MKKRIACSHYQLRTSADTSNGHHHLPCQNPSHVVAHLLFALSFAIATLCRASCCARVHALATKRANLLSPSRDLILSTWTHSRRSEAFHHQQKIISMTTRSPDSYRVHCAAFPTPFLSSLNSPINRIVIVTYSMAFISNTKAADSGD